MAEETQPSDATSSGARLFTLLRVFLKRASFDRLGPVGLLTNRENPNVDFRVGSGSEWKTASRVHVTLRLSLKATAGEQPIFELGLDQCGVFDIEGYPAEELQVLLRTRCLKYLYPYAREIATSLIGHSGMDNLQLIPLTFAAVHGANMMVDGQIPLEVLDADAGGAATPEGGR